MRKLLSLLAVLSAVALPAAAHAQLSLGFRLGYARSMGDAYEFKNTGDPAVDGTSANMSDGVSWQVPAQLEAAFRITPQIAVGAYFSYGLSDGGPIFASTSSGQDFCSLSGSGVSVDCSASAYRVGVQGSFAFTTASPTFVPWVGLGLGWEWTSAKADISGGGVGGTFEENLDGFELSLQGGGEWKIGRVFALGPFLQYSIGRYSGGEMKVSGFGGLGLPDQSVKFSDFANEKLHEWLTVGVRGKFDL
jgi:hypothetical protein